MLLFKCRKISESKNSKVGRNKNGRMLLSKCSACNSKKLKFLKKQEARGLLSSLGIRTVFRSVFVLKV